MGQVLDGAIGDLGAKNGWLEGSTEKTLLHGISGIVQAKLGGTSALSGFAAGVVNEQIVQATADYLQSNGVSRTNPDGTPNKAFGEYMTAATSLVGAGVGAFTGGGKAGNVAAGGAIAGSATTYNYLSHEQLAANAQRVADCKGDATCIKDVKSKAQEASLVNNEKVQQTCVPGASSECLNAIQQAQTDLEKLQSYKANLQAQYQQNSDPAAKAAIGEMVVDADRQIASATHAVAEGKFFAAGANYAAANLTPEERVALGFAFDPLGLAGWKTGGKVYDNLSNLGNATASGTKLPIATDGTATSPYNSNGTAYGNTTLTDANGKPVPTAPTIPGAANGSTGPRLVDPAALDTLAANGVKFTPGNVVATGKTPGGQVVFLETGNPASGLQHIVLEHGIDFANIGISEAQIPSVVTRAVSEGNIVGYQGSGTGRPVYEITVNGQSQRIAITTGSNGYIVGANPAGRVR